MTDYIPMLLAAAVAMVAGAFAGASQHRLYRRPEHRAQPASGARRLAIIAGVAAAAGVTAGLAFRPDHYDAGPALVTAAFCVVLVVLSSTDFERRLLPNRLMYPALIAALALCWTWPDRSISDVLLGGAVAVGVATLMFVLGVLMGVLVRANTTTFGLGDVKLIILMGLLCGWPAFVAALFIGILAAGVPSVILLARGKARSAFSYGPFLAFGCLIVLLWPGRFV